MRNYWIPAFAGMTKAGIFDFLREHHYLKWLRYYLDFGQRYRLSESNSQSLTNFIRKLKEKRQTKIAA
jgi:hypothetical protein